MHNYLPLPRILHITNAGGFGRIQRGGGERAVEELSAAFSAVDGWTAAVCAPAEFLATAKISPNVRQYPVKLEDFSIGQALRPGGMIESVIAEYRPNVVITHLLRGTIVGLPVARKTSSAATISILHNSLRDAVKYSDQSLFRRIANLSMFRLVGRLASAHVAISPSNRIDLVRYDRMPSHRVHTINNWVSTEFTEFDCTGRTISGAVKRLMIVGRLEEQKNHGFIIKRILPRLPSSVVLDIVGEGALEDCLKRDVNRLGLGDRVFFHGLRRDIPALMSSADVVLVPSLFEGFGRVAVEAMSVGTRVLASDVPGLRDVCRSAPPNSVSLIGIEDDLQWEREIRSFLTSEVSESQRQELRLFAARDFSLSASVGKYAELVENLLANSPGRSM